MYIHGEVYSCKMYFLAFADVKITQLMVLHFQSVRQFLLIKTSDNLPSSLYSIKLVCNQKHQAAYKEKTYKILMLIRHGLLTISDVNLELLQFSIIPELHAGI